MQSSEVAICERALSYYLHIVRTRYHFIDPEEFKSYCWVKIMQRYKRYNASKSTLTTYISNCVAYMIPEYIKQNCKHAVLSLSQPIPNIRGSVYSDAFESPSSGEFVADVERRDLCRNIADFFLQKGYRGRIAYRHYFQSVSKTQIAREENLSPSEICRICGQMRSQYLVYHQTRRINNAAENPTGWNVVKPSREQRYPEQPRRTATGIGAGRDKLRAVQQAAGETVN